MSEFGDGFIGPAVPAGQPVNGDILVFDSTKGTKGEWIPTSGFVLPASPTVFTQTYATTDTTVATATAVAVSTAAAGLASYGYSQAQADAIPVAINALIADNLNLRKLINKLIDIDQAAGFAS